MADNPYVNKVDLADGSTLIDLTGDTATEADVVRGKTFHLASGAAGVGSMDIAGSITDSEIDSVLADSAPTGTASLRLSQLSRFWNGLKAKFAALNAYPVGSIYMSVNSTSPATLFGGTWERITGSFLLAATDNGNSGASQAAGNTGGAATVTLTSAQSGVPAHAHGLNSHKHSVGAHAHGLNSHTHGVGTYAAASGGAHKHKIAANRQYGTGSATDGTTSNWKIGRTQPNADGGGARYTGGGEAQAGTDEGSHSHSITGTSGAASGSTANSTAFDSGAASGNTANNTASNASQAHENMPPYLSVYVWKRTA